MTRIEPGRPPSDPSPESSRPTASPPTASPPTASPLTALPQAAPQAPPKATQPVAPPRPAEGEPVYGFPAPLWRAIAARRPPLPRFRSPLRGPWLTSVFAVVLLVGLPIVIVTGLLSYIAYGPQYGQAIPGDVGPLHLPYFDFPASPSWLYHLTQGLHVNIGIILVPVVLAKLWSVVPKLFAWPPVASPAQALERLSLLGLVGGILFEIVTGLLNLQYDYVFGFSFYLAHYVGAWVFLTSFVAHVALKLPTMVRSLRSRSLRAELRTSTADTRAEGSDTGEPDETGLVAERPIKATLSRRGALGVVFGGSLFLALISVGQTIDVLRPLAFLLPRGRWGPGAGGNDYPINKTFVVTGIDRQAVGTGWRLDLTGGPQLVRLDLPGLAAQPQHTADLPLQCVEGWATTRTWTGVRLRDLAALAGVPAPSSAVVRSLESGGPFNHATLTAGQVLHPDSLLATQVNGEPLSLDHGFPARVIASSVPGVHNTKWVRSIEFRSA